MKLLTILFLLSSISCQEKKKNNYNNDLPKDNNATVNKFNPILGTITLGEKYNQSKIFDTSKNYSYNSILNSWIYQFSNTKLASVHPFVENNIITGVELFFNQTNPWIGFKDAIPAQDVQFYKDLYSTKYGKNYSYKKGIDSFELQSLIFSLVTSKFSFDPSDQKLNASEIEMYKWDAENFTIIMWFQKLKITVDSEDIYWGGVKYKLKLGKYKNIINSKNKNEKDSIITTI